MEPKRQVITTMLSDCIDQLNEQRGQSEQLAKTSETCLGGDGGNLDSLGFVNLVAIVEEACQERFGRAVMLTESAVAPSVRDPFETIGSLAEYVELALAGRLADWR